MGSCTKREILLIYIQELDKKEVYLQGLPTDIIIEVDGYEVVNVDDLIQLLQDKKKMIYYIVWFYDGEMKRVDIKILMINNLD